MQWEHAGIRLWYGTPDAPAPGETVEAGRPVGVTIGVQPVDPSNRVEVRYRVDDGPIEVVAARWLRTDSARGVQYFVAQLPNFRAGDRVAYAVVCHCAGRQAPSPDDTERSPSSVDIVEADVRSPSGSSARSPGDVLSSAPPLARRNVVPRQPAVSLVPDVPPPPDPLDVPPPVMLGSPVETADRARSSGPGEGPLDLSPGGLPGREPATGPTGNPPAPPPQALALPELAGSSSLTLDAPLLALLADRGIRTLADVREAGGLGDLDGLAGVTDAPTVARLEAHARLSLLAAETAAREAVIDAGFADVPAIARADRADFVEKTHGALGDLAAARLHARAGAQAAYLSNVVAGVAADLANGGLRRLQAHLPPAIADRLSGRFEPGCSCEECESAVSPLAYLADLIRYVKDTLRSDGRAVDYVFLESTFHQKFGTLPKSCAAVQTQVRQVRISVEVLRGFLRANRPTPQSQGRLEQAERSYLRDTYQALLVRLGTTSPSCG